MCASACKGCRVTLRIASCWPPRVALITQSPPHARPRRRPRESTQESNFSHNDSNVPAGEKRSRHIHWCTLSLGIYGCQTCLVLRLYNSKPCNEGCGLSLKSLFIKIDKKHKFSPYSFSSDIGSLNPSMSLCHVDQRWKKNEWMVTIHTGGLFPPDIIIIISWKKSLSTPTLNSKKSMLIVNIPIMNNGYFFSPLAVFRRLFKVTWRMAACQPQRDKLNYTR